MGFKLPGLTGRLSSISNRIAGGISKVANKLKTEPEDLFVPQSVQNMLPINARAFASDILGNVTGIDSFKSEINQRHLSDEEKLAITNARERAQKNNRQFIGYNDYFPAEENIEVPSSEAWDGSDAKHEETNSEFIDNVMDPRYATKTTFGRMSIKENPDGTYTYNYQFDYNDAKEGGFGAFVTDIKDNPDLTMYQKLRKMGTYLGSGPGEGAKINITY